MQFRVHSSFLGDIAIQALLGDDVFAGQEDCPVTIELTRVRQDAVSSKTAKFETKKQCLVPRPARGVGQGTFFVGLGGPCLSVLGSTLFFFFGGPHGQAANSGSDTPFIGNTTSYAMRRVA
jgi:hypothetical protein